MRKTEKQWYKKGIALALCFLLTAGGLPVNIYAGEQDAVGQSVPIAGKETAAAGKRTGGSTEEHVSGGKQAVSEKQVEDALEISELISDTWEEDYFGTMVVDTDAGKVEIDGETEKLPEINNKKRTLPKKRTEEVLEQYMDTLPDDRLYEVEETEKGEYEITAPFQTKRLIVEETSLEDTCQAEQVYYNTELGETILQFETEEKTKEAFETLSGIYGEGKCYPDEIYHVDDILEGAAGADSGFYGQTASGAYARTVSSGSYSWGNAYMGMNTLKAKAAGKYSPVTVAVLDTGIDKSNFMFRSRSISSKSYNFVDNNKNITDNYGHGTHVAGIIADGTPSNVRLLVLKISNTSGYSSLLTIKTALQYALNQNVSVVNMSLGFVGVNAMSCTYLDSLINKAYRRGIAICAAAGNSGVNVAFCYPACNSKTFAVSAMTPNEHAASYSNYGDLIDFCAPGSQVVSAAAGGTLIGMSGTSMATPHIAAAAAYIKMMQPNLSVSGIYNELKLRCKDLGAPGKDQFFGWGCPILTNLLDTGIINKKSVVANSVSTPMLKSVKNVDKGVRVVWKKIKNADKYYLYRKTGNGSFKKIKTLSKKKNSYLDKKVKQGKKYTYAVKAVKNKKRSKMSASKRTVWLKKPSSVKVKVKKGGKMTVTWLKQARVSGYQIRYGKTKKMKSAKTITVLGKRRETAVKNLNKKTYYCKVRSMRKVGNTYYYSGWSAVKKGKRK